MPDRRFESARGLHPTEALQAPRVRASGAAHSWSGRIVAHTEEITPSRLGDARARPIARPELAPDSCTGTDQPVCELAVLLAPPRTITTSTLRNRADKIELFI